MSLREITKKRTTRRNPRMLVAVVAGGVEEIINRRSSRRHPQRRRQPDPEHAEILDAARRCPEGLADLVRGGSLRVRCRIAERSDCPSRGPVIRASRRIERHRRPSGIAARRLLQY